MIHIACTVSWKATNRRKFTVHVTKRENRQIMCKLLKEPVAAKIPIGIETHSTIKSCNQ